MAERRFPVGDDGFQLIVWDSTTVDPDDAIEVPAAWLVADPPPEGEFHPFHPEYSGENCLCVAMGPDAEKELVDLAEAVSKALACLRAVARG